MGFREDNQSYTPHVSDVQTLILFLPCINMLYFVWVTTVAWMAVKTLMCSIPQQIPPVSSGFAVWCRAPMWKLTTGPCCTPWLSSAGCSPVCCPPPSFDMTGRYKAVPLMKLSKMLLCVNTLFSWSRPCCCGGSSDGNLATKQVVFLQRPVKTATSGHLRNQVRYDRGLSCCQSSWHLPSMCPNSATTESEMFHLNPMLASGYFPIFKQKLSAAESFYIHLNAHISCIINNTLFIIISTRWKRSCYFSVCGCAAPWWTKEHLRSLWSCHHR